MTTGTVPGPRLLFVVSKDPGQLALAMSLLEGQDLLPRTRMLLPVASGMSSLPLAVPTSFYTALPEIQAAVDGFNPDIVVFLSAYWFQFDGVASPKDLGEFLARLQARGCRVVTSDPLFGLASRLTLGEVDPTMLALGRPAMVRWLVRTVMFVRSSRARFLAMPDLRGVTHVYPVTAPDVDDGIERVSFFNPAFEQPASPQANGGDGADAQDEQRWAFVVSDSDIRCQTALVGMLEFIKNVLHMLQYATEQGRSPTLIAPPELLHQVTSVSRDWGEFLPIHQLTDGVRRILDAEYAFFWDAFSGFQVPRLAAGRPVFHFDRGYLSRTIRPYYDAARACHLGGWEPKYLDPRQIFSPYVLAHLAKTQAEALAPLRERWRSAPSPDELVDRLMQREAAPEP